MVFCRSTNDQAAGYSGGRTTRDPCVCVQPSFSQSVIFTGRLHHCEHTFLLYIVVWYSEHFPCLLYKGKLKNKHTGRRFVDDRLFTSQWWMFVWVQIVSNERTVTTTTIDTHTISQFSLWIDRQRRRKTTKIHGMLAICVHEKKNNTYTMKSVLNGG